MKSFIALLLVSSQLVFGQLVFGRDAPQLGEVLESAKAHFPAIQSAVQERLIREGRLQSALGAFDLALAMSVLPHFRVKHYVGSIAPTAVAASEGIAWLFRRIRWRRRGTVRRCGDQ